MYFVSFDGLDLFMPFDSQKDAVKALDESKRVTFGSVTDINGSILFSIDRRKDCEEKIIDD